ncbi:hypothetical protein M23134_06368 [Microscilla marina ATCC 23134]|uniref:Uncharacterized protein n=1 Tax=Microscilla marina ATCC 23134 TaxID=313606 RepID=A1ZU49_MICM2|nr:hypothetical protein M23134_06368 [Microscilla marina ATCC 23134]
MSKCRFTWLEYTAWVELKSKGRFEKRVPKVLAIQGEN